MVKVFKKIKFKIKRKGSATVEAAMIFPLIMFILFGIIYLTMVHYQNNVMIAESIRAMNRAGAYWQYIDMDEYGNYIKYKNDAIPAPFNNNLDSEYIINNEMIRNRNVYRTIIDLIAEGASKMLNTPIGNKKFNAKEYVNSRVSGVKFKQYKNDDDKINDIEGNGFIIWGSDLSIQVGRAYINPLQDLSRTFFGKNSIMGNEDGKKEKNIKVTSIISNQSEFIRNIDTLYDIGCQTYDFVKFNNKRTED